MTSVDEVGGTPLITAALTGDLEWVRSLLREHPALNHRNHAGESALTSAAFEGHTAVVKVLLEAGCDPHIAEPGGVTTIMLACSGGFLDAARELQLAGASVDATDDGGWNALHHAVAYGQRKIVLWLAPQMANLDRRNLDGRTPLDIALTARPRMSEIAGILLKHGARP